MSGVSRRAWARNANAIKTVGQWNETNRDRGHVTTPTVADTDFVERLLDENL
jgi:hypothetical protein